MLNPSEPRSSLIRPEKSMRRILASPRPATVCSSSGLMRGVRSIETREEQPAASDARSRLRMRRYMAPVYRGDERRGGGAGRRGSARVKVGHDLDGQPFDLVQDAVGGAHRPQDELRAAAFH